ncbi:MAG: hypothetical protein VXX91_06240 [Planctomycetota bacterium]|nr:hypothetical protein [Planctomycetota bacterium]
MTNMLKGTELLDTIRKMETADRSTQCIACGYVREDGKPAFTAFYEAILEARGVTTNAQQLKAENPDSQETIDNLLEDGYSALAIEAFIEYFGEESLGSFVDAYQCEMTGAEFAQQLVEDCYGVTDIPWFVSIDWNDTWENLRCDYVEVNDYIFCRHF